LNKHNLSRRINCTSGKSTKSGEKSWGGRRKGAGRPVGKGLVKGEKKITISVPYRCKDAIKQLIATNEYEIPVYSSAVRAGAPTQVADEYPETIKLIEFLTDHPAHTFFVRAEGDSMINANINDGDMLVVDSALDAADKAIIVASVDNEQTVKRLRILRGKHWLYPENPDFKPIPITDETAFTIHGIVRMKLAKVG
jgi:DNA polymerase V